MTAYTPPPTVTLQGERLAFAGRLTQDTATRHAAAIKRELDALEAAVAALPESEAKAVLKRRALRLHNALGRGGQLLNDHFQTADVSPSSVGGDKDDGGGDQQQQTAAG